jgi:REP element-mobilizing transposase RayT
MYHCITRVVERRLAFGQVEKEQLRMYLRMQENFTGCRVLAYCLMCNHVHLLLEVPPMAQGGLSDAELLKRLGAIYGGAFVAEVAAELRDARQKVRDGLASASVVDAIHGRFTYRMHDLGEFMKTLLQRFTRWFNTRHERTGTLWESRFKSVLIEEGVAVRTVAAYIDLNPVRAGMVAEPSAYRWSSYGEALGGGPKGDGKKARAGLVRALMAHSGIGADAARWAGKVSLDYRRLLLEEGVEKLSERVGADGGLEVKVLRRGMKKSVVAAELKRLDRFAPSGAGLTEFGLGRDRVLGQMLRCRVRYFTDGAVIGSRGFVDEVFRLCRDRFGEKRKDGARKWRGNGAAAAGTLWSIRDLKKGLG